MTRQYTDDDLDEIEAERSDAELITAVRSGDESAFATLWSRHEGAAHRLARQISNPSNADDLVSEAFLRVLRALQAGNGPDGAFRPYLFSTLRRINIDNGRSYYTRVALTDDERDLDLDHSESAADVIAENAESTAAWRAWNSLPDATKTLLWHLIIEEETPAQIAPLIGTTPNGVSSRAVRAKERLRQAFLQQHLLSADNEPCRQARRRFGEYVRDALSARDRAEVRAHLDTCDACQAALFEVSDINQTMKLIIGPAVLGGLTVAGYMGAGGAAAAHVSVFAHLTHIGHLFKNPAVAIGTAATTVVVAGVAVAGAYVANNTGNDHPVALAPVVASSSSSIAPAPVVPLAAPTSITPSITATTPTPTPAPTTPKAKAKTTPKKVVAVVPSSSIAIPTSSSAVVAVPPAPVHVPGTSTITFQNASSAHNATLTMTASTGWIIIGGTRPSAATCTSVNTATVTCTWATITTATQEFDLNLQATAPAPSGGTVTYNYTDDTNHLASVTDPADPSGPLTGSEPIAD